MTASTFSAILPTLMVGFLMVIAGLGKRRLEIRPRGRRFRKR